MAGYAGKVVAPSTQMAALFRCMAGKPTSLMITAQQAEAETDFLGVIRNDPESERTGKKPQGRCSQKPGHGQRLYPRGGSRKRAGR